MRRIQLAHAPADRLDRAIDANLSGDASCDHLRVVRDGLKLGQALFHRVLHVSSVLLQHIFHVPSVLLQKVLQVASVLPQQLRRSEYRAVQCVQAAARQAGHRAVLVRRENKQAGVRVKIFIIRINSVQPQPDAVSNQRRDGVRPDSPGNTCAPPAQRS